MAESYLSKAGTMQDDLRLTELARELLAALDREADLKGFCKAADADAREAERERDALRDALRPFLAYPRYLSIGWIDNTVEVRVSAEKFERAVAAVSSGGSAGEKAT